MAQLTLLDVAKNNGTDTIVGLIEENLVYVPELQFFPVRQIRGTSYYTRKRTANPSVEFRNANEGVTPSKSTFAKQLVECFILSSQVQFDKAVAAALEMGMADMEMSEASGVMKQAMIELASQIWYGVSTDTKGFPGIKAAVPKDSTISVNSGGSTATSQSSVYAVKFGTQDVTLITGSNSTFQLGEFRDQTLYDSDGKAYEGRTAGLMAWVGLQIGNVNCVGRILNVGADNETGDTLTDAKINTLLGKFPIGYVPDRLFMSRRSRTQLQNSRTVVINSGPTARAGGAVSPVAEVPTESMGVQISASEAILDTDAVES